MNTKRYVIVYYVFVIAVFILLFYFKSAKLKNIKGYAMPRFRVIGLDSQEGASGIQRSDFNSQKEELRVMQDDSKRQQDELKMEFDDFKRQQDALKRQQDEMANFTSRQVDIYKTTRSLP